MFVSVLADVTNDCGVIKNRNLKPVIRIYIFTK